jgi:glycogen debranching enzyme
MMGGTFYGRAKYLTEGFYQDISKHGVGLFSELYDGDPPHEPHGAISCAMSTAALLRIDYLMNKYKEER